MTQVAQIVRDALGLLRVQDSNQAVKANDARDCINGLNQMMRLWEAEPLTLGWSDVSSMDEDMPTPPEADGPIGQNLALWMRPHYGKVLDGDVVEQARDGKALLKAMMLRQQYNRCDYSDLPDGVGNQGNNSDGLINGLRG
jgi:hypothetical protein